MSLKYINRSNDEEIIDKLELCEAELKLEIKQMKDTKRITASAFHLFSNTLDRRDLAMKSLKRLFF